MLDPQSMSLGSIMPVYPWLISQKMGMESLPVKIRKMQALGVPYPEGFDEDAMTDLEEQADMISENLNDAGLEGEPDRKIVALIAYLQRLGSDIKPAPQE